MLHVPFDRFHQVGNEVGAALHLHVHAAPGFFHQVLGAHQPVVDGYAQKSQQHDNGSPHSPHKHNSSFPWQTKAEARFMDSLSVRCRLVK